MKIKILIVLLISLLTSCHSTSDPSIDPSVAVDPNISDSQTVKNISVVPTPTPKLTTFPISTPTPTPTPKITTTPIPTPTPKITTTPIPTPTPKITTIPIPTPTPKITTIPIPTPTPKITTTPIPTPTPKITTIPIPTPTPKITTTPIPTPTPKITTAPIPTPTPTPTGNDTVTDFKLTCEEARFVALLNIYRTNNQLTRVAVSKSGVESTRWHAQDMIDKNYFSHTEPNGRTFSQRAQAFGYPAWAENIAAGNVSASDTFCQWKNSPGHNTNMLRPEHRSIGIGNAVGGEVYRSYWANNFGPIETDLLIEPLNKDNNCSMPTIIPTC